MMNRIRQEILDNLPEYANDGYLVELATKAIISKCTSNICLYKWYRTIGIQEYLENCCTTSSDEEHLLSRSQKKYKNKFFVPCLLQKLGACYIRNFVDMEIENETVKSTDFYTFSKKYASFLQCINHENIGLPHADRKSRSGVTQSIRLFDVVLFYTILSSNYKDIVITSFLQNIANDKIQYEAKDKQKFIVILIYAVQYCRRHKNTLSDILMSKLKQNIFLLKTTQKYKLSPLNEQSVDKYLLDIKQFEDYDDESRFLNFYYKTYLNKLTVDKSLVVMFVIRLTSVINDISYHLYISLLKRVFMMDTPLYDTIDEMQLHRLVIDYFNKKVKKFANENFYKVVLSLYTSMLKKIVKTDVYDFTLDYIITRIDNSIKSRIVDQIYHLRLMSICKIDELVQVANEYKESYSCMKDTLYFLQFIIEDIYEEDMVFVIHVTQAAIDFYNICDVKFLFKFTKVYYNLLETLLWHMIRYVQRDNKSATEHVKRRKESNRDNSDTKATEDLKHENKVIGQRNGDMTIQDNDNKHTFVENETSQTDINSDITISSNIEGEIFTDDIHTQNTLAMTPVCRDELDQCEIIPQKNKDTVQMVYETNSKNHVLDFFNKNIDVLSNNILSLERYAATINESEKKKDKKGGRNKCMDNFVEHFVNAVYTLEDALAVHFGKDRINCMKTRSFKVIDKRQK